MIRSFAFSDSRQHLKFNVCFRSIHLTWRLHSRLKSLRMRLRGRLICFDQIKDCVKRKTKIRLANQFVLLKLE
jgi:hypothetical protein